MFCSFCCSVLCNVMALARYSLSLSFSSICFPSLALFAVSFCSARRVFYSGGARSHDALYSKYGFIFCIYFCVSHTPYICFSHNCSSRVQRKVEKITFAHVFSARQTHTHTQLPPHRSSNGAFISFANLNGKKKTIQNSQQR